MPSLSVSYSFHIVEPELENFAPHIVMTPEAVKYVAIIYKPSLCVAVTPEAIKYVAVIYKLSLTVAVI